MMAVRYPDMKADTQNVINRKLDEMYNKAYFCRPSMRASIAQLVERVAVNH